MNEYYIWPADKLAIAQAALNFINNSDWFPLPSYVNGVPDDTAGTTAWVSEVSTLEDGRHGFEKIPDDLLDQMGVSLADRQAWLDAFKPTIETEQADWWPEEEII